MLSSRWTMLAALFLARAGMGFQYQTVASSVTSLRSELGLSMHEIGILVGAYFVFGIVVAAPGGALGAKIGARNGALLGLALMVAGGVWEALASAWTDQLASRTLAGVGGVLVNVMMAKLVNDWFASDRLATAMGIFVSSWTFGVAIALICVPWIDHAYGYAGVFWAAAAWAASGLFLVAALARPTRPAAAPTPDVPKARGSFPFATVILAGLVWGWFNAGFANIFNFGPAALISEGVSSASAGLGVSLTLWASLVSVPLGGVLADRLRAPHLLIAVCPLLAGLAIWLTPLGPETLWIFAVIGLVIGLPAGPIMALPQQVLAPHQRAIGMGLFFTVFYATMAVAPMVAARLAEAFGSTQLAYQIGALWILLGSASYGAFRMRLSAARPSTGERLADLVT